MDVRGMGSIQTGPGGISESKARVSNRTGRVVRRIPVEEERSG